MIVAAPEASRSANGDPANRAAVSSALVTTVSASIGDYAVTGGGATRRARQRHAYQKLNGFARLSWAPSPVDPEDG